MLTLRFQRQGKKKDFIFRIKAVDSKIAVNSGKAKEILGWWDPRINKFELKKERILYWLSQGAQPSDSCYNLLIRAKIIEGKKRPVLIRKKKAKEGEEQPKPVSTTETTPVDTTTETIAKAEERPKEEPKPEELKEVEAKQEEKKGKEAEPGIAEKTAEKEPIEEKKEDADSK